MTVLADLCHARAGDKGADSILVIAPYDRADVSLVGEALAPARLAEHFGVASLAVEVRAAPGLGAFTIIVRGRLDGGVTRSLGLDPHGKTLSGHLLTLDVPTAC